MTIAPSVVAEYFDYVKQFDDDPIYSDAPIDVIMQVGSFYEMYASDDVPGTLRDVSRLLMLQVTRKDKAKGGPADTKNPHMIGFPCSALHTRYLPMLVNNGRTVVVIDQIASSDVSQRLSREIVAIHSPGTFADELAVKHPRCCHVYCESTRRNQLSVGLTTVDIITGKVRVFESHGPRHHVIEDVATCIQTVDPTEVFILGSSACDASASFRINNALIHKDTTVTVAPPDVVNTVLRQVYNDLRDNMLEPVDVLSLYPYPLACTALTHALNVQRRYRPDTIGSLKTPEYSKTTHGDVLSLQGDVLSQIAVLGPSPTALDILDKCVTKIGSAAMRDRLFNPATSGDEIERRLTVLDALHSVAPSDMQNVHDRLRSIGNCELMLRRLRLRSIRASDLLTFSGWVETMVECHASYCVWLGQARRHDNSFAERVSKAMQFSDDCLRLVGVSSELDAMWTNRASVTTDLCAFINRLRAKNGWSQSHVKVTHGAEGCMVMLQGWRGGAVVDVTCVKVKSGTMLSSPALDSLRENVTNVNNAIESATRVAFLQFCDDLSREFGSSLETLFDDVAAMDVDVTHVRACRSYCLTRPSVDRNHQGGSFVRCKGLRHLIIEQVNDVPFTPVDIEIADRGVLLHGINSSGKSTLIKSLALAVILAQAGFYVPCSSMHIRPFAHLLTQVDFHDNIHRGTSSYVEEIRGLRAMLERAGPNALLLADELTRGTETRSSVAVFAATVKCFQERGARFLMSSHLTRLEEAFAACGVAEVRVCHFAHTTQTDGTIVYTRKLEEGRGPTEYGLMVAECILGDLSFSGHARKVIASFAGTEPRVRSSRYNRRKKVYTCELCGAEATETHHIRPQKDANDGVLSDGRDVHALHNLAALCESCHRDHHRGQRSIKGYVHTTRGKRLVCNDENADISKTAISQS